MPPCSCHETNAASEVLKVSLRKQVITGSQQRLPLKAVSDVAASFGAAVGTSALATKAQACPYRKIQGSGEGGDDEMIHGRTRLVGVKDDIQHGVRRTGAWPYN